MNDFATSSVGIFTKAQADAYYALLAGRAGGQTLYGGIAASENLILNSTSHATKGQVRLATATLNVDGSTNRVGINTTSPVQALHLFDGNFRMDQVTAPSPAPTVAVGAAGVLIGAYQYGVSYVTALGETEVNFAALSSVVNPSSQQVNLTGIPISSDSNVTSRKIYRTTAGGTFNTMQLLTILADNTTTVFSDNTADGSLTTAIRWRNQTGANIFNTTIRILAVDDQFTLVGLGAGTAVGGYKSVGVGRSALASLTTGYFNTAVGHTAMSGLTSAISNTGIGFDALAAGTSGGTNTGVGSSAGRNNQTGTGNVWLGAGAGTGGGINSNSSNTGVGSSAGTVITTGNQNVIVGASAGLILSSGGNNILIGMNAGNTLTTGGSNILLGFNIQTPANNTSNFLSIGNLIFSAGVNATGTTISTGNVGIGVAAPAQRLHVMDGHIRLDQVAVAGAPSVAAGAAGVLTGTYFYMVTFVTATGETGPGTTSASVAPSSQQVNLTNIPISTDASVTSRKIYRTVVGGLQTQMQLVTTLADNTTTTFSDNIADGSLTTNQPHKNTTGGGVFVGTNRILFADATFTGLGLSAGNGTAIGGFQSVAIGATALGSLTTGYQNSAIGFAALAAVTSGTTNTGMGYAAGNSITTGSNNTLIGQAAGQFNVTGTNNTFIGVSAGTGASGQSHTGNTGIGRSAGLGLTTGGQNVLLGYFAGSNLTTGATNIILGYNIQTPAVGTSNFMSIGNLIFSAGIDGTGTTLSSGNIGIGVVAPSTKLHTVKTDAGTNTVVNAITAAHYSSGTPAAGLGVGIVLESHTTGQTVRQFGRIRSLSTTAADASFATRSVWSASDFAAERDAIGIGASGTAALLGFFPTVAAAPVVQQTVATLTNNVTVGGTTGQIDDFAGSLYATDAATIRNDIYQLARELKLAVDALRTYGLFG